MFGSEFEAAAQAAAAKSALLKKNPAGYFILSMLAGMYVGFGVLLAFTTGGLMGSTPGAKLVMGMMFSSALSLVVFAGSELFTGNNFVMTAGVLKKKATLSETIRLWVICYLGNAAGSLLILKKEKSSAAAGFVQEFDRLGVLRQRLPKDLRCKPLPDGSSQGGY